MKYRITWILTASFFLISCGDDPLSNVKNFVAEVRSRPPQPIKELPDIKQVENFVYQIEINDIPRRDPFERTDKVNEPSPQAPSGGVAPPDPLRRKEQLEQYELDALNIVGTIFQKDIMWGLILTPDAGLFRVKAGNYIGKNNGQINRITENKIELTEIVADKTEGWKEHQAAISIKTKD